jgi:6,7-dimethyl-8-ribityllumazine synthase
MASHLPSRPRKPVSDRRIAIVASTYHKEYARGLVDRAKMEIEAIAPGTEIHVFGVPGSYEIPLVVQTAAEQRRFDAIIAFGVLLEGQTAHARLISTTVTEALMRIMLATKTPVVHEVLVVDNDEQARERCLGDKINRGIEAARVALSMAGVMDEITNKAAR